MLFSRMLMTMMMMSGDGNVMETENPSCMSPCFSVLKARPGSCSSGSAMVPQGFANGPHRPGLRYMSPAFTYQQFDSRELA